jgi:integrase/recombinase XerD
MNVINFPAKRIKHKQVKATIRSADGFKYFTEPQIKLIRRTARDAALLANQKNQVTATREWMLLDLLTSTGLRESEAAGLRCGDLRVSYGETSIFVRNGKGSKSRTVQIPDSLKNHLKTFIIWKRERGEPTGENDYLFIGQRGAWKPSAVQQAVKKYLRQLGLYQRGKSAHSLRHSYAVELYKRERDLRTVQKQLGHASIQTTQIYADVLIEDVQRQIKNLWN